MSPNDLQIDEPRSRPRRQLWSSVWRDLAIAVAVPVLVTVPTGVLAQPDTVDELVVENATEHVVAVLVTDADRDGWVPVALIEAEATVTVPDVIDQGDVWRFRFQSQGQEAGELVLRRQDLTARDWHLTFPPAE